MILKLSKGLNLRAGQDASAVVGVPRVLLACMPKSGSTFLCKSLSKLPGMRRVALVPGHERREQELDEALIVAHNDRYLPRFDFWPSGPQRLRQRPPGWVAQHHVRYHDTTARLLQDYAIQPVVLVRNIFDVVPSLLDHLSGRAAFIAESDQSNSNWQFMAMAYVGHDAESYDDETFLDFISEMVIPWYFNFYVSWTKAPSATLVTYEELTADPAATIARIGRSLPKSYGKAQIESALKRASGDMTRKNKGIAGRGTDLPERVRERIEAYARFYPSIDFSPIGIGTEQEARAKGLVGIGGQS